MEEPFEPIDRGGFYRYRTPITRADLNPDYPMELGMLTRFSRRVKIGDIIKESSYDDLHPSVFYGDIGPLRVELPRRLILSNFDHIEKTEPIVSEPILGGKKTRRHRRKTTRRKHKKRYSRKYRK